MIRRRLSEISLLVTVVALVAVGGAVYFVHSRQVAGLGRDLLQAAEAFESQGEYLKAAEKIQDYLALHPRDQSAYGRLADDFTKGAVTWQQKSVAVEALIKAVAVADDDKATDIHRDLARMLVEVQRPLEAETHAKKCLEKRPEDPVAAKTLAQALFQQLSAGLISDARLRSFHVYPAVLKAVELNPNDLLAPVMLAKIYRDYPAVLESEDLQLAEADRFAKADEAMNAMVERNANDVAALLSRYEYRRQYHPERAAADLEAARKLAPEDARILAAAANEAFQQAFTLRARQAASEEVLEACKNAETQLERVLAVSKEESIRAQAMLFIGDIRQLSGRVDAALETWRLGIQEFQQPSFQFEFQKRVADVLLDAGQLEQADVPLSKVESLLGILSSVLPREILQTETRNQEMRRAVWYLKSNRPLDAVPLLRQAASTELKNADKAVSVRALTLLGFAFSQVREWGEAALAYDRAAKLQPENHALRAVVAEAWIQAGRPELAADRAEEIALAHPTPEILYLWASIDYMRNSREAAPKWERFESTMAKLDKAAKDVELPWGWKIPFLKAHYELRKNRGEGGDQEGRRRAAQILRSIEERYADKAEFLRGVVPAYQMFGFPDDADRNMKKLEALEPNAATTVAVKARLAMLRNNKREAADLLLAGANNLNEQEAAPLRRQLADLVVAMKDAKESRAILEAEWKRRPNDLELLRRLAGMAADFNDIQSLDRYVAGLRKLGEAGQWWADYYRIVRKFHEAKSGSDPLLLEAKSEQEKLLAGRPYAPECHALGGMIEERLGRLERAASSYEQAVRFGEGRASIVLRYLDVLESLKRGADAERLLAWWRSSGFSGGVWGGSSGEVRSDADRMEGLIRELSVAVDANPSNLRNRLRLARLQVYAGQVDLAEASLKQIVRDTPTDVRAWTALVDCYARTGKKDLGVQAVAEMKSKSDLAVDELALVAGNAYELLGNPLEAVEEYQRAAEHAPHRADVQVRLALLYADRGEADKADECLQKAAKADPESPEIPRIAAKLFLTHGRTKALDDLGSSLIAGPTPTVEDMRLYARVLAKRGGRDRLQQAGEVMQRVCDRPQGALFDDRLFLAQIYDVQSSDLSKPSLAKEREAAASELYIGLAKEEKSAAGRWALFADFLLRKNRSEEAETLLEKVANRLEKAEKADPADIAPYIELRIAQGKPELAEKQLPLLEKVGADPLLRFSLIAKTLEALKQGDQVAGRIEDEAEKLFAEKTDDPSRAAIARTVGNAYFAAHDYVSAESWYARLVKHSPTETRPLYLAITKQGRMTELLDRLEKEIDGPQAAELATIVGNTLIERPSETEDAKRADALLTQVCEKNPKNLDLAYVLGTVRLTQRKYDQSIDVFLRILEKSPQNIPTLNNLAIALAEIPERREEALSRIDKALEIAGPNASLIDSKAAILLLGGRGTEALPLLQSITALHTSDSRYRFHLAWALQITGKEELAKAELKRSLDAKLEEQVLTASESAHLRDMRSRFSL